MTNASSSNHLDQHRSLETEKPPMVVGIVVDQMRYEYLPRFWNKFEEGGFKRLIKEGYNFKNNYFNYFPPLWDRVTRLPILELARR